LTKYRPDIDGMRAIAVLAVILFHAFPKVLPGGFVGVDIFFVISGYLITRIILRELEQEKFSLAEFYLRRIRRIFPALVLVLITCIAAGWYLLALGELNSFFKNVFASALFSANLMLLSEVSYFDVAAHAKPLLHLWSLGIEEQFYLAWPAALMLTPRRWLAGMVVAILLISFALNIAFLRDHPSAVFYLPFTRVWELAAGALVLNLPRPKGRATGIFALVGALLIASAFVWFTDRTPFPGWAATVPVAGTMLLLLCQESWINTSILASPTAVSIGLISYPLYLWHWPVLVFATDYKLKALTDPEKGLAIGLTFVLAALTYKAIELPLRFSRHSKVTVLLVSAMAAIAMIGMLPSLGFVPKLPDAVAELIAISPDEGMRAHDCMLFDTDTNDFGPDCVDRTRPLVVVWGDSTAAALIPGFRKLQETIPFGIAQFTIPSCPPMLRPGPRLSERCIQRNESIIRRIAEASPDVVLLEGLWSLDDTAEILKPSIEALQRAGIQKIIILGTAPGWLRGLPEVVTTYYRRTGKLLPERVNTYFQPSSDSSMEEVARELGVQFISSRSPFCNQDGCLTRIGSALVSRDEVHLTPAGARFLVNAIAPNLGLVAAP
jgi:peptidoglycan/LPS O-acetylase OafA/YrhL